MAASPKASDVLGGVATKLRADFAAITAAVQHRGAKGRARELQVLHEYLAKYLPGTVRLAQSGEAIDVAGGTSNEQDILVLDPRTPLLYEQDDYRIAPVECVHGAIEIKSMLDARELEKAHGSLRALKMMPKAALKPQSGAIEYSTTLFGQEWSYFPTYGCVFAYDSIDLVSLRKKLEELQTNDAPEHRIDTVWVLNKGMIVNWDDKLGQVVPDPRPDSRLRAVQSENPLLLMTVLLQQVFEGAWMPHFRLVDYLKGSQFGDYLDP